MFHSAAVITVKKNWQFGLWPGKGMGQLDIEVDGFECEWRANFVIWGLWEDEQQHVLDNIVS